MGIKVPVKQAQGRPFKILVPFREWAVDVAQWIVDYMEDKDRIATGGSVKSVNVEVIKPSSVRINAASSVKWALGGRKSGGGPPSGVIAQWIRAKKQWFQVAGDMVTNGRGGPISVNSLAFLIGRKIRKKGTNPPKLRRQNIALVIESKGKKYLTEAGIVFATQTSNAWMDAIAKEAVRNVTIKSTAKR